jgi:methylglutaconyl-CoA hydratase
VLHSEFGALRDRDRTAGNARRGMKHKSIEVQRGQGVAVLWLARPELRNAFDENMIAEVTAALEDLDGDATIRAVVLAGQGKAFCAGADLDWMKRMKGMSREENFEDALRFAKMLNRLYTMNKPTVARVHGAAYAGGIGLLAACDIAVASNDAEFCLSEVKLGLAPATISPYVVAAMGERAARRYCVTAERFTAAEAYRIGLVQEIALPDELDATVNAVLGELVQGAPAAQAQAKEMLRAVAGAAIDEKLIAQTAERIAALRVSEEGQEGMAAFFEKRRPAWVRDFGAQGRRPAANRRGKK